MGKDRLVVCDKHMGRHGYYCIGWWLADDQEMGGYLGQTAPRADAGDDRGPPPEATCETTAAEAAVWDMASGRADGALYWTSDAAARRALRVARAAAAAYAAKKPLPDWAVRALAAGWTPPKGWAP